MRERHRSRSRRDRPERTDRAERRRPVRTVRTSLPTRSTRVAAPTRGRVERRAPPPPSSAVSTRAPAPRSTPHASRRGSVSERQRVEEIPYKPYKAALPASAENRTSGEYPKRALAPRSSTSGRMRPVVREVSAPQAETRVFVGNLSSQARREDLQRFFEKTALAGVVRLTMKDGYALAEFSSKKDADCAVKMNGAEYLGKELHVSYTYDGLWRKTFPPKESKDGQEDDAHKEKSVEDYGQSERDGSAHDSEHDVEDEGRKPEDDIDEDEEEGYDEPEEHENEDVLPGENDADGAAVKHERDEAKHDRNLPDDGSSRRNNDAKSGNDGGATDMTQMMERMSRLENQVLLRDCEIRRLKTSLDRFEGQSPQEKADSHRRGSRQEVSSKPSGRDERTPREGKVSARGSPRSPPSKRRRSSRPSRKHGEDLQTFININKLDESCRRMLNSLTESQQSAVMDDGYYIDDSRTRGPGERTHCKKGNRSAIVVGRINRLKDVKHSSRR
eukprot:GEMP01030388.1.p1 GENE.GEMP01030388.1~~GEMP01030388.1.p1  ORF type:complete len:502 (+),score=127.78 GEMP01030388.1:168-1673(+)